jgi:hypothetical protein
MTKTNTNSRSVRNNRSGGKVVKTNDSTASVAPEGGTIEQPTEVVQEDSQPVSLEKPELPVKPDATAEDFPPAVASVTMGDKPEAETPTEQPAPEAETAVVTDPFADLPMVKIEDYEFRDLSAVELVSDPRKYEGVHREAVSNKAHMKKGWKHSAAMIALGTNRKELKPTSVYGTISSIVASYGRAGVPAYVLVAKVRQAQIGNKRSHYCTALPPVGWAEGWIDTFISKNMGKVMEKKAPAITEEVVAEIQAGDAEALQSAQAA